MFILLQSKLDMRGLLIIVPLLLLIASCSASRQVIEVPVETIKTEYIHDTRIDSIYTKDSIDRWRSGDTIFIYKEHTKYRYLSNTDTVIKTDTIPKIIKVETKEVVEVNHIKWYQTTLMWIGGLMSLILSGYIIYKLKFK